MTKDLLEIRFGQRPYRLQLVELSDRDPFWAICGSKKGSHHTGGGIPIPDLQTLYRICNLIDEIAHLDEEKGRNETRVCCLSYRGKTLCGETRSFNARWFYRIKGYTSYFLKDGEIHYYKQHRLKPAGRGYFIQEFDFPISAKGIEEAKEFSGKIRETIETHLVEMLGQVEDNGFNLIRNEQILIGGEPPWFNSDPSLETVTLHKPLFDCYCDKLRKEPMTPDRLAVRLGLTPNAGERQLNPASRYDPRFLEQGLLLDRVRKGFNALHYLVTQIPLEALEGSPTLTNLFEKTPPGNWPDWISATFSNDEYSTGRRQSYHLAEFEIEAFEGGMEWGISPELGQLRATAIRLFDLKRHFRGDAIMAQNLNALTKRFVAVTKEAEYV